MKIKLILNGSFPVYPAFRATSISRSTGTAAGFASTNSPSASVYPPTAIGFSICDRSGCDFVLSVQEYFYMAKQWCAFLVLPHLRRTAFCCRLQVEWQVLDDFWHRYKTNQFIYLFLKKCSKEMFPLSILCFRLFCFQDRTSIVQR